MRLAIADPPYPPLIGATGDKPRASRWYGDNQLASDDRPADCHSSAAEWDDPARHRQLLVELMDTQDGWAIATAPDGIEAYGPLPRGVRIMAWVKPSFHPGSHRIGSGWEPVLLFPPVGRRSNRGGVGLVPDVLIENKNGDFTGAKPTRWTWWVLDAMTFDPSTDEVTDMFSGSGRVSSAVKNYQSRLEF